MLRITVTVKLNIAFTKISTGHDNLIAICVELTVIAVILILKSL